jgi:Ca2+-binding EF-hand superfamily protein
MSSSEQEELVRKVLLLVQRRYGSTDPEALRKLFDEYDRDRDQKISAEEFERLLKDADVGNAFTRGAWVKGVIGAMDSNADRKIDWNEFTAAVK